MTQLRQKNFTVIISDMGKQTEAVSSGSNVNKKLNVHNPVLPDSLFKEIRENQESGATGNTVRVAFEELQSHLTETTGHSLKDEGCVTMEDVQMAVVEAQVKYGERKGSSKATEPLTKLVSRIIYFLGPLDLLAQHNPEYASLVWGTIRFILRVCIIAASLTQRANF